MSEESRTVASLKGELSKFSGIISRGFKKLKKWLIKEMLYGIQASKDVKLSNTARTLKEEQPFTMEEIKGIDLQISGIERMNAGIQEEIRALQHSDPQNKLIIFNRERLIKNFRDLSKP